MGVGGACDVGGQLLTERRSAPRAHPARRREVYYDDFFSSSCRVSSGGNASFCDELATNITGTSYTHTNPDDNNYYWVVACNNSGCSPVDSNNPATTIGTAPDTPTAHYAFKGSTIVLGWDAVDGASYYNIYYDDFHDSACRVNSGGRASFCDELATNITDTSYTHTNPDPDTNYYWVVACNNSGCSPVNNNNPATTVGTAPDTPTAHYAFKGSTIVLGWDAVADASYYNVYYDDFFSSSCRVSSGGNASFCEGVGHQHHRHLLHPQQPRRQQLLLGGRLQQFRMLARRQQQPRHHRRHCRSATRPTNQHYAFEGSTIVLGWDAVADATYYRIYYDDFHDSSCRVNSGGNASFCDELATNITDTSYTHTNPDDDNNYYWVVACNNSGCSPVDSNNPATTVGTAPDTPTARYAFKGSTIVLGWDAVADASYYNIYYDDFFSSSCRVSSGGNASFCDELATNITGTSYTHTDPDDDNNYYWVVACNNSGCSQVDSNNPATTIGTAPDTPTARYAFEGSTIVLSWDACGRRELLQRLLRRLLLVVVPGQLRGNASFCEELATNITGTSYTHNNPDDNNYYWVVACNSSGCSPVDSNNPATTDDTAEAPPAPTNQHYAFEGSTIVLGWDAVADASYYRIYYDDFFPSSCRVNSGGNASFCDELATNITDTSYTHTDPTTTTTTTGWWPATAQDARPWTATTPPPRWAPPRTRRQPTTRSRVRRSCWAGTRSTTRATTTSITTISSRRHAGSAQEATRRSVTNSRPTSQAPPTPTTTPTTTTTTTGWWPATAQDARPWTATTPPPRWAPPRTRRQPTTRSRVRRSCWAGTRSTTRATTTSITTTSSRRHAGSAQEATRRSVTNSPPTSQTPPTPTTTPTTTTTTTGWSPATTQDARP